MYAKTKRQQVLLYCKGNNSFCGQFLLSNEFCVCDWLSWQKTSLSNTFTVTWLVKFVRKPRDCNFYVSIHLLLRPLAVGFLQASCWHPYSPYTGAVIGFTLELYRCWHAYRLYIGLYYMDAEGWRSGASNIGVSRPSWSFKPRRVERVVKGLFPSIFIVIPLYLSWSIKETQGGKTTQDTKHKTQKGKQIGTGTRGK